MSLPDYRDDAEAYELEERSRPDEMAMLDTVGHWAACFLHNCNKARVLDLCCGTGLSMEHVVDHPCATVVVGVDISRQYLAFANLKYKDSRSPPVFVRGDAVESTLPFADFDVILMASAYHHIEDARKVAFLRRVHSLLGKRGHGFIAENILPPYDRSDRDTYAAAVRSFYEEVYQTAVRAKPNLDPYVAGLIRRVAQYGFDGEYEYKVCWSLFEQDLHSAGLSIIRSQKVWPTESSSLGSGGNYVLEVSAA
jgi:SAM-dependent methyltransferase